MSEYMNESEEDLFDLKYMEAIGRLFSEMKHTDDYYGTDLLLSADYCPFMDFIKDNVVIHEFDNETICDEDGEFYVNLKYNDKL